MEKPCESQWLGQCEPGDAIVVCDFCGINLAFEGDFVLSRGVRLRYRGVRLRYLAKCPACVEEESAEEDESAEQEEESAAKRRGVEHDEHKGPPPGQVSQSSSPRDRHGAVGGRGVPTREKGFGAADLDAEEEELGGREMQPGEGVFGAGGKDKISSSSGAGMEDQLAFGGEDTGDGVEEDNGEEEERKSKKLKRTEGVPSQ